MMKWALNFDKKYKKRYYLSCFFLIIFDTLFVFNSIFAGILIDRGLNNGQGDFLLWFSLFLVGFIMIRILGSVISVIILDRTVYKIVQTIREKCYQKLQELDFSFYQRQPAGELLTIVTSDTATVRHHVSYTYKTMGAIILRFIIALLYCLSTNIPFTFLLLCPIPFIVFFSFLYVKKSKHLYQEEREKQADLNNFIQDNIEGNKVVRSYHQEESEIAALEEKSAAWRDKNIDIQKRSLFYFSFVRIFSNMVLVLLLCFGGFFLMNGTLSLGQFVTFQSLAYTLRTPFLRLNEILDYWQRFFIAKGKINQLLNTEPEIKALGTTPLPSLFVPITFNHVTVQLDGKDILKDIHFSILPGQTVAFLGPTGSGKSSIANLLLRFIEPREGTIRINGIELKELDQKSVRQKIGYVTQQPFLFSDTISNNIRYGNPHLSSLEEEKIVEQANLGFTNFLAAKLETIIGERGVGLSGGEKQRLCLARALAVKPQLLILDDITSALDMETETLINDSLKHLEFPCSKIIIAQKIVSVKDADQIYVVSDHKILEHGTHDQLLQNKKYYYEIYQIQNNQSLEVGD